MTATVDESTQDAPHYPMARQCPFYPPRELAEVDVDRSPNHHLAFGHGVHQCLGQQLARVELQVAYPALLRRFPGLRVDTPLDEIAFRDAMVVYGVHALPTTW